MMKTGERRLRQVETSLTPRQAAVLWMQEAHGHGSAEVCALAYKGQPDSAYPLVRLPRQVEEAVREALKGQPRRDVDTAVRAAVKDVIFLFRLQFQAKIKVIEEHRVQTLLIALLVVMRPEGTMARAGLGPRDWKADAEAVLLERYRLRAACEVLATRYFAGNDVLFPDDREDFDALTEILEGVIETHNEGLAQTRKGRTKKATTTRLSSRAITLGALARTAQAQAEAEAAKLVDKAKIDTLRLMGEYAAANALMDECFWAEVEEPEE